MLRLFLPMRDAQDNSVRWSQLREPDYEDRSSGWEEFRTNDVSVEEVSGDLSSAMGVLDEQTATALSDHLAGLQLTALEWVGYRGAPSGDRTVTVMGELYDTKSFTSSDIVAGNRIPGFVWDENTTFAWGSRLYPDSIVIGASPTTLRALHSDPNLDVVSIRAEDVVPFSFGD
ncbi:hypothetical protein M0722_11410 [Microbacterium sp. KSW4-16]|uniref:hypothetical protein n=1 Tax=Microbacterium aurugineum TaxID=2851642 RepID=UPI0020BD8AB4|nr:hypothetical protein [Microbacterium aurugineum]MCK8467801.1 hypothetical protein [Microbacterium aurugineum]